MTVAYACGRLFVCMREFRDEIFLRGGELWNPGKAYYYFFFSENERICNSCWDGTNKTLDFSLDLR